jgi:hypothetical protein
LAAKYSDPHVGGNAYLNAKSREKIYIVWCGKELADSMVGQGGITVRELSGLNSSGGMATFVGRYNAGDTNEITFANVCSYFSPLAAHVMWHKETKSHEDIHAGKGEHNNHDDWSATFIRGTMILYMLALHVGRATRRAHPVVAGGRETLVSQ